MCDVAFVIGRHVREPFVEGGGKITYLLAKALSELGIQTYLLKINYSLPQEEFHVVKAYFDHLGKLHEWELRIGLLSQDSVLHKSLGMVTSNIIECVVSPLIALKLIKRVSTTDKNICVFIGNSSKLGGLFIADIYRLFAKRTIKVLAIYRREEILRLTSHIIHPEAILTTSKELLTRSRLLLGNIVEKINFSYPPVLPEESPNRVLNQKLPVLLYMGRLTNQRFPLRILKEVILSLKKASRDVTLLIVSPPESVSIKWLKSARELVSKLDARNRVVFILKMLDNEEKRLILTKSSIFIFPSQGVAAVEPPLSVIESLVYGQYLITSGDNSTKELIYSGVGLVTKNFENLDIDHYLAKSNKLKQYISRWAQQTFTFERLMYCLKEILFED